MARTLTLLAVLSLLFAPALAAAQRCDGAEAWAEACSTDEVTVELARCLPGGVIVTATPRGAEALEVEVAHDRPGAFRQVAGLGLSPIGEYPDWSQAAPAVKEAFAWVAGCVEADPNVQVPEGRLVAAGPEVPGQVTAQTPWLLVSAFLCCLFALGLHGRAKRPDRRAVLMAVGPVALIVPVAFLVRNLIAAPSFVHQNGQGPHWVTHALCVTSAYGPGYFEVWGMPVARIGGEPSAAVFLAQGLLGALAAGAAWLIARGAGVPRALAAAITAAVIFEPALCRLSQSESYFGTITSLLLLGAAALSVGARNRPAKDPVLLLSVLAAGLFVAQAARVHPVAWLPSALLPLVLVVGPGALRPRLRAAFVATVGVGLVAAVLSIAVIMDVAGGGVGDQWLPDIWSRVPRHRVHWGLAIAVLGGGALYKAARERSDGLANGFAFFTVVSVASCSHLIAAVGPIIVTAYYMLFAPSFIAVVGAGLTAAVRQPARLSAVAVVVVVAAGAYAATRAEQLLTLPTDAREQAFVLRESAALPGGATVGFLGVAGPRRRLFLPLYGECGVGEVSARQLDVASPVSALGALSEPAVWYRSSLCSTREGRAYCEEFEGHYRMSPIVTTDLPARPSMDGLGYDDGTVHVGLYAIEGPR